MSHQIVAVTAAQGALLCLATVDAAIEVANPTWIQAASSIGSIGFMAWYAWHVTTKAIPDLVKRFTTALEEQRLHFEKLLGDVRLESRQSLEALRREDREELDKLRVNMRQSERENAAERRECLAMLKAALELMTKSKLAGETA